MNKEKVLLISGQVANQNGKVNFPDLNYPNTNQTILRYLHKIDYETLTIQLDGEDGPTFSAQNFPKGVGFYEKIIKIA